MLDLARMERITLTARPVGQRIVAMGLLAPNYNLPPQVRIRFEGVDNLPPEPVIVAMNHTDRYNYWPFQYRLWRKHGRFTATWVKGKYYENEILGRFMEMTNNIPTVSRGYLIARDALNTLGRALSNEEYRTLRALVDEAAKLPVDQRRGLSETVRQEGLVPEPLFARARDMLGRAYNPSREDYAHAVNALFRRMIRRFVALNAEAASKGLDVIIFPQGTRSVRLSKGHIGLAQVAIKLKRPIVPVGCSGCDRVYPGDAPLARGGDIVYRFGQPLWPEDYLARYPIEDDFEPFDGIDEQLHRATFQSLVDEIMLAINELVDEPYRFSEDLSSDGVQGTARFL